MTETYRARLCKDELSPEMRDLIRRRTIPFLDSFGMDRPLSKILEEVYLQGIKDAVQGLAARSDPDYTSNSPTR